MKKSISIFFIFSFLFLNMNTINAFAQQTRTLTQGIYNVRDTNLLIGSPITARMTSTKDKAIIIVIDPNQTIHALVRLGPDIPQEILPPLNYDYSIVIYGTGSVALS